MRKVVLADYKVKGRDLETGKVVDAPYSVRESMISILFLPALQLQAKELLERDKLANKINDTKDGFVLLEDAEFAKIETAVNTHKGFGKNDVEFVRRVLEAETVEVAEKPVAKTKPVK